MVYEEGKTPHVEEPLNTSMYDIKITEYIKYIMVTNHTHNDKLNSYLTYTFQSH
jgi:hypothetical protein